MRYTEHGDWYAVTRDLDSTLPANAHTANCTNNDIEITVSSARVADGRLPPQLTLPQTLIWSAYQREDVIGYFEHGRQNLSFSHAIKRLGLNAA